MSVRICHYNDLHHPANRPRLARFTVQPEASLPTAQRDTCRSHLPLAVEQMLREGAVSIEVRGIERD